MWHRLVMLLVAALAPAAGSPATPGEAPGSVQFFRSPMMAAAGFPLSEAVRVGQTLYLSGQLGTAGRDLVPGGIVPETHQTMKNIGAILERHGLGFDDLVKCIVFLADIDEWPAFNTAYAGYFTARYPARSALGGTELVRGARVEIDCIAAFPD